MKCKYKRLCSTKTNICPVLEQTGQQKQPKNKFLLFIHLPALPICSSECCGRLGQTFADSELRGGHTADSLPVNHKADTDTDHSQSHYCLWVVIESASSPTCVYLDCGHFSILVVMSSKSLFQTCRTLWRSQHSSKYMAPCSSYLSASLCMLMQIH